MAQRTLAPLLDCDVDFVSLQKGTRGDQAGRSNSRSCLPDRRAGLRRAPCEASNRLKHDPEKCAAVFRKDHAQTTTQSAMMIHPNLIAL